MNFILLEPGEIDRDAHATLTGRRAEHITRVLQSKHGDELRVAMLDGPRGTAIVGSVSEESVALDHFHWNEMLPPTGLSMILALPRPKVLKRLWGPLASLGIDRIVLVNAEKVERNYFDTHWLDPETYRPRLIEGLEQSGETRMPEVLVRKRLKPFVEDELDKLFSDHARFIAHPGPDPQAPADAPPKTVLAIGPEGGWSDYELELFSTRRFIPFSLGPRILRSDVACITAIAAYSAVLQRRQR